MKEELRQREVRKELQNKNNNICKKKRKPKRGTTEAEKSKTITKKKHTKRKLNRREEGLRQKKANQSIT